MSSVSLCLSVCMSVYVCVWSCEGHTRTSIMRASDAGGHFAHPELMLPETRAMFEQQDRRRQRLLAGLFILISHQLLMLVIFTSLSVIP